jgi:ribose transport system ATP-binding protein
VAMNREVLLEAQAIIKSFTGTKALKGVDLTIHKGMIHGLIGENGAGKSTLIKILTGAFLRDSGSIRFKSREVEIRNRQDAQDLGIAVIFQELSLIPTLTVAQNVLLGREPIRPFSKIINKKELLKTVQNLLDHFGFPLDAGAIVETLSISQRQLAEIVKALSLDASLIIMDEPTASLTATEADHLFKIIRDLRNKGISILFISHRMEEVLELADEITILRDGERVALIERNEMSPGEIIRLMIGKSLGQKHKPLPQLEHSEPLLEVRNLTRKQAFSRVSFSVGKGEILGIAGLVGAGRTEILRAIFGADPIDAGEIYLDGQRINIGSIQQAIALGFGLIPEDRRIQGLIPLLSISRNIALSNYDHLSRYRWLLNGHAERELSSKAIDELDIRPPHAETIIKTLSGGNQQKVVLAKWLGRRIKILLIDEPTAGVDVGAKEEIYNLIENLARAGVGIILVSSDLFELIRLSNRVLVLRSGRVVRHFAGEDLTEERILSASAGIE